MKVIKRIKNFIENNKDLIGVFDKEQAFIGPQLAQIDVTNMCNNDCIGCWCRSPLLLDKLMPEYEQKFTLPFEKVKSLLYELHNLGTKEIYLAGGGEPFMHPQILDIIKLIKELNFVLYINTNFTLITPEIVDLMVALPVDHLTVSIWAGTGQTYEKTHPNKTEETFEQICDMLRLLVRKKKGKPPYIKIYNVISKLNYFEILKMAELALDLKVESVEYTVIDTIPGRTDVLLLSEEERLEAKRQCEEVKRLVEKRKNEHNLILFRFDQFYRRISNVGTTRGEYDIDIIEKLPCYVGWVFTRILPDGNVNGCLKAHRIPIGNIYEQSFTEIWNSIKQREFRRKTLTYKKTDPFFKLIGNDPNAEVGCYRSCDDLGRNQYVHYRINQLSPFKKAILKSARIYYKYLKRK